MNLIGRDSSLWPKCGGSLLAERPAVPARLQVEVEMQRMIGVAAWSQHRLERPTGGLPHGVEELRLRIRLIRLDPDLPAVGEAEARNVQRIAEGMFGKLGGAVARAADIAGGLADRGEGGTERALGLG